jgi:hypothetical protein
MTLNIILRPELTSLNTNIITLDKMLHDVMSSIVVTCRTRRSSEFPRLRAKRRSPCDAQTGSERVWDTEKAKSVLCF